MIHQFSKGSVPASTMEKGAVKNSKVYGEIHYKIPISYVS